MNSKLNNKNSNNNKPSGLLKLEKLALDNEIFSEQLIRIILQSIAQAHTNDLKSLFKFLNHILETFDAACNKMEE